MTYKTLKQVTGMFCLLLLIYHPYGYAQEEGSMKIERGKVSLERAKELVDEAQTVDKPLTGLEFLYVYFEEEAFFTILESLELGRLTTLRFIENMYATEEPGEYEAFLINNLPNISALTTFELSDHVGDESMPAIIDALKNHKNLKELLLLENNIGDESALAMAEFLRNNRTLEVLDLGYNEIGDEGACAIARVLGENRTLLTLRLNNNHISVRGTQVIIESLVQNNVTIQELRSLRTFEQADIVRLILERNRLIVPLREQLIRLAGSEEGGAILNFLEYVTEEQLVGLDMENRVAILEIRRLHREIMARVFPQAQPPMAAAAVVEREEVELRSDDRDETISQTTTPSPSSTDEAGVKRRSSDSDDGDKAILPTATPSPTSTTDDDEVGAPPRKKVKQEEGGTTTNATRVELADDLSKCTITSISF